MAYALEAAIILVIGMLLGLVIMRAFGRSASDPHTTVKLVRTARTADGREETRLFVNDTAILMASNDGVGLAEYADEVEQLEAVAARMAAAMGVTVEFTRVAPKTPGGEGGKAGGIPMRNLPKADEEDLETRRRRLDDGQARGG